MKKVIKPKKEISLNDLVYRIQNNDRLTVVYKAKSDMPYYAFFTNTQDCKFGFNAHTQVSMKMTYVHNTIRESLEAAIDGGKELLVFERDEMDQLFKF